MPRSVVVYGPSGSSKTSQMYFMAKYIYKTTGKKVRMIHADPGGYAPFIDSGLIEQGIVEVFNFSNRTHCISDIRKLSMGYWPRYVDKASKKVHIKPAPGLEELFTTDAVCLTRPQEWEGIGGYIIESLSSIGEILKNHCSDIEEGVGFKPAWKYTEDDYTITGLQEGHYGIVQKEMHKYHSKGFNTLPIDWLLYTSLVGKGEDKQRRETVYGPQLVGNASTPSIPGWFMDCLYLSEEKYQIKKGEEVKEQKGMVAWFTKHNDPTTEIPYLAKARVMPEMFPELIKIFPYGFVPLKFDRGIDDYFRVLEMLRKKYQGSNTNEKENN